MLWWLAFPFAPKGSVSVMTWTWACKFVLKIFEEVVQYFILPMFISAPEVVDEKTSEKQKEKIDPILVAEVD